MNSWIEEIQGKILSANTEEQASNIWNEIEGYFRKIQIYLSEYDKKQGREEVKAELRQLLDLQKAEE